MKLQKFAVFFIIAAVFVTARVSAATFKDDMNFAQNTAATQYEGLKIYNGSTYGLSDPTLLTFSDTASPLGYALYRVNGAEKITVGIYTSYGTCAVESNGRLILGMGSCQAGWSRSKNAVYSILGGLSQVFLDDRLLPVFSPVDALPGDVVGFGINIYALPHFNAPLNAEVTRSSYESLCYEEYTVSIPPFTQYIKVEINDITSYSTPEGAVWPNRVYTLLASAEITGERLIMGETPKTELSSAVIPREPVSDNEGEDEAESFDEASAGVETIEPPDFEPAYEAQDETSSSSKFEGTITSPSSKPNSKANRKSPEESKAPPKSEAGTDNRSESDNIVYEIRREKSGDSLDAGVTAYVIAASGAIVLLLIIGKR